MAEQPQQWKEARIVMIPKPGKDHSLVKGWRPIVLANTIGKLAEKMVAEEIQEQRELWHPLAYAGRKGRGAMDLVMLAKSMLENNSDLRMVGWDIQSAFNGLCKEICVSLFKDHKRLQTWVAKFLNPREIDSYVDGKKAHSTVMTGGTPQGSPLSPALFMVYISELIRRAELRLHGQRQAVAARLRPRPAKAKVEALPLSYIDDVNTIIPTSVKTSRWHEHLTEAGDSMKLKWDKSKDWEGKEGKHLGVYLGNERKHWTEPIRKAEGAWSQVCRLTRLPPAAKATIVRGQLIPILCYGCEAFDQPTEEMIRLVRKWTRWVVGAWAGSNADRVAALSRIEDQTEFFRKQKIRWAASMYGRHLPDLRAIVEKVIRNCDQGHNIELTWMEEEVPLLHRPKIEVTEYDEARATPYSDGSRLEGAAAAATTEQATYLGEHATVMDAEMLGVHMAITAGHSYIALDSEGAINRLEQLYTEPARSWIELEIQKDA